MTASELLRCLVALGYLTYNRYSRIYKPTARVALIGACVEREIFRDGTLMPLMETLAQVTGLTVAVTSTSNYAVQHLHVVRGSKDCDAPLHRGDWHPILHCPQGRLILSTYREAHIRSALHRLNADERDPNKRVCINSTLQQLAALRQQGWIMETEEDGDLTTLCVMLPRRVARERLVISVAGPRQIVAEAVEQVRLIIATSAGHANDVGQPAKEILPMQIKGIPSDFRPSLAVANAS